MIQEREWDWEVNFSGGSMRMQPVSVPLEKANRESRRAIAELLAIQRDFQQTT